MSSQFQIKEIQLLANRVRKSDPTAYKILFDNLWDAMAQYASAIVNDNEVAKDILQDLWLDYWKRRESVQTKNIKAYLYSALRKNCYKHIRDNKLTTLQTEVIESIEVEEEIDAVEASDNRLLKIKQSLLELPPRCSEIFILSRINQLTNLEIADSLNISKKTVENQISSALKKIRKDLTSASYFLGMPF